MRALCTIISLFWAIALPAQTTQEYFEEGNEWYRNGNMQEAVYNYEMALEDGLRSVGLEYNLGNAYFKLGKIGLALVHYERALLLSPEDEEILHNIQIAKSARIDKIIPLPPTFLQRIFDSYSTRLSRNAWYIVSIIMIVLASVCLIAVVRSSKLLFKRVSFVALWAFLAIGFISLFTGIQVERLETTRSLVIITKKNSYVKSGPEQGATDLFILHEGSYGFQKEERNGYYRIVLEDGKIGWLPQEDAMVVRD